MHEHKLEKDEMRNILHALNTKIEGLDTEISNLKKTHELQEQVSTECIKSFMNWHS